MSKRNTLAASIVAWMSLVACVGSTFAADAPPANQSGPTKEEREKMAILHEQMAACLRSDKPIGECRSEMMKNCHDLTGGSGCMMGMGMQHRMMKNQPTGAPTTK